MKQHHQNLKGKASFRITGDERMILENLSTNHEITKSELLRLIFRDYLRKNNHIRPQYRPEINNKSNLKL